MSTVEASIRYSMMRSISVEHLLFHVCYGHFLNQSAHRNNGLFLWQGFQASQSLSANEDIISTVLQDVYSSITHTSASIPTCGVNSSVPSCRAKQRARRWCGPPATSHQPTWFDMPCCSFLLEVLIHHLTPKITVLWRPVEASPWSCRAIPRGKQ